MRRSLLWVAGCLALSLTVSAAVWASKVQVWEVAGAKAMLEGKFKHTLVSSEGKLRLSLDVRPTAKLDAAFVWDLLADHDGRLLAATGNDGRIYRIVDGKPETLVDTTELEVLCLAVSANPKDKAVYAGTAPNGQVLRIAPGGKSQVLYDTPDKYVWRLVAAADGTVYAATGPKGRVYKIKADGKVETVFDAKQSHILSLALGPKGVLYAGTDGDGLIYAISPDKKVSVVYDAPEAEIKVLLVDKDGTLYAGTSDPKRRAGSAPSSSRPRVPSSVSTKRTSTTRAIGEMRRVASAASAKPSFRRTGSSPSPRRPSRSSAANSVYRISPNGQVQRIFEENELMVLALHKEGDRLLVGTGPQGELYEIGPNDETSLLARVEQAQVMAMGRVKGAVVFGTGGGGARLYSVSDNYAPKGEYTSDVKDTGEISRWGRLTWVGKPSADGKVTVATRTGNVKKPDATWSNWSKELTAAQGQRPTSPGARFIQFRIALQSKTPKDTPTVEAIKLFYAQDNQPPQIKDLDVAPPSGEASAKGSGPRRSSSRRFPGTTIKWKADDPNDDDLAYTLSFRKQGWGSWIELVEETSETQFKWDTRALPVGMYQIRLVASDKPHNAPDQALTDTEISVPFPVDHQGPAIAFKKPTVAAGKAKLSVTVTDQLTVVEKAEYCVDGKDWQAIFPDDRLFDSPTESFTFTTEKLDAGHHVIIVKAVDAHGNTSTGDVTIKIGK